MIKALVRMYSGQIYLVEETLEEIWSYYECAERADQGFVFLTGRTAGSSASNTSLRLKFKRIEAVEAR